MSILKSAEVHPQQGYNSYILCICSAGKQAKEAALLEMIRSALMRKVGSCTRK